MQEEEIIKIIESNLTQLLTNNPLWRETMEYIKAKKQRYFETQDMKAMFHNFECLEKKLLNYAAFYDKEIKEMKNQIGENNGRNQKEKI